MRAVTYGFGLLALACGAAPWPGRAPEPHTVAVAPPSKAPEPEPPPPSGPVLIDGAGERARWLDPPTPLRDRKAHVYDSLLAAGDHAAVTRSNVGEHFAFDEAVGVVGPLQLPERTERVLFGPKDSLLVVTKNGALLAAPSVSAATSEKAFELRTAPANVVSWDSAGDYLIASDGKQVHLSRDGGKSWNVAKSAAWGTIRTALVRSDGVMAVQGGPPKTPVTFLSRDDGKTWQRSSFQPERLSRSGAFIWSDTWNCTAVLSENGSTWSKAGDVLSRFRGTRSWTTNLMTSATPEGFSAGVHRSLDDPPAPRVPGAKERRTGRGCPTPPALAKATKNAGILGLLSTSGNASMFGVLDSEGVGGLGLVGSGGGGTGSVGSIGGIGSFGGYGYAGRGPSEPAWGSCSGGNCMRPPPAAPEKTRTRFELFRDGRCSASGAARTCSADSTFERAPHVSIVDESTGKRRVAELPAGCAAVRIVSAAGLGLLACRAPGGLKIFAADSSGAFKAESALSDAAMFKWAVSAASDGSLLLHELCAEKKPCRALVRRPAEPGVKDAWRELKVTDALGYRVLSRGRVLAVARGGADKKLDFFTSEPGSTETPLVRGIALEGDLMDVRVDDKGRVVVRERRDRSLTESFVVGVDGKRHPL